MKPRGVAGYVETFLLIGAAMLGGTLVYASTQKYAGAAQGPPLSVSDVTARQGGAYAILRFLISNLGNALVPSFFFSVSGASPGTTYCYSAADPNSLANLGSSCPTFAVLPASGTIPVQVKAGGSVVAEIILSGSGYSAGQKITVVVGTPNGGLASQSVLVLPA